MGSLFEAVLLGPDEENLDAVASAVREEVERVERLLSRFDPRSEISRINREAFRDAVRVDRDLIDLLDACKVWWTHSEGFFDITCSASAPSEDGSAATMADVILDPDTSTVRFARPGIQLDLGGVGKGYALDCAADILAAFSVDRFFLHGGTSSALAHGRGPDGQSWRLGVRDPWSDHPGDELCQVALVHRASSCSAIVGPGHSESDIVVPPTGRMLTGQGACLALANMATEAEILSTALLAMGKPRAADYIERSGAAGIAVAWIERVSDQSVLNRISPRSKPAG
ncbi:MAG TPA: FAD:protein FMN transferase [Pirellulales bacterium]|nr:FAD:protein FMN transferase [Pirellulales bacterium]